MSVRRREAMIAVAVNSIVCPPQTGPLAVGRQRQWLEGWRGILLAFGGALGSKDSGPSPFSLHGGALIPPLVTVLEA